MMHYAIWNFVLELISVAGVILTCAFTLYTTGVSIYWIHRTAQRSLKAIDTEETGEIKVKL
jgi:uncharacterized protein (DUF2062 family)